MDAMILNRQWSNRPADERFATMQDLHAHNIAKRDRSLERGVALDHMRLAATEDGGMLLGDAERGGGAYLSHWAFGQLCQRVGAPAGYLRSLPAPLAAIPLQWSMEAEREDAKVLLRRDETWRVDAVTSDTYGRIFDAEMTGAIMERVDLATWKVPAASYAARDPKRATTLYASDRDCFVCLVDDEHPIEVPGANGADTMFRGFIVRNSEVGAAAYDLFLFLYRRICDNRIIHGLGQNQHLKIRHTAGGPMRFMKEAQPALQRYLDSGTHDTVAAITAAREKEVGKTEAEVMSWLAQRGFTKGDARRTVELAQQDEAGGNPRSLWGVVQGATRLAHEVPFGDERFVFERKVGSLLNAVAVD